VEIRLPIGRQFIENMLKLLSEQPDHLYKAERALLKQGAQQWKDQYGNVRSINQQDMVRLVICKRDAFELAELVATRAVNLKDMTEGNEICPCCESVGDGDGRSLTHEEEDEVAALQRICDVMSFYFDMGVFEAPAIHVRKVAAHAVAE
jgi:hypothetical protein